MRRLFLLLLILVSLFLAACNSGKKVLYVFNWTDYIDPELISRFERENDCKVKLSTYDSNENMLIKVKNSRESFDLVFPSGDHVSILAESGLLEPLDKSKLLNYPNLDPQLLQKAESFDPGNQYAVPYFWGLTGLIYNKSFVPATVVQDSSWSVIANAFFKENRNKVTMLDDAREVIGAALLYAGYDVNDTSQEAMDKAGEILSAWDNNITQFDSDSYKNEVQDGTSWLAQAYNGDALQLMSNNADLGFFLPKEGSCLWMDSVVILKSSKNKDLAHKFIDFLLDAENARANAEHTQYATPNKVAKDMLSPEIVNNSLIYPSPAYLEKCFMIEYLGEEIKKIDALYEQIKMI